MQIRIANIIRGTLIGNTMSVLTRYISRVVNGGGIVEKPQCVETALNSQSILQQASLLVVPSGYKGGTLYSEIPTNGNGDLTWTRGGDAFRTNASGVLQRVPWNLLQQSETFSNAFWTKTNATISADTTTAPNGTTTADLLYPSTSGSTRGIFTNAISIVNGTTYTWTIYAKASGKNWLYINCWITVGGGAYFNLSTGVVGTVSSGVTASIENVGNGWYRCTATRTSSATASTGGAEYYVTDADNSLSVTASGTNGVFIWGAQLVEGTTAQTYLPTTDRLNFPRLSYMYGSCPSALLEPQRTNLITYSQEFNDASWNKVSSSTGSAIPVITANATTAPDGTSTADLVEFTPPSDTDYSILQKVILQTVGLSGTIYVKAFDSSQVGKKVGLYIVKTGDVRGTAVTLTNQWQRVEITRTADTFIEFTVGKGRTIWTSGGISQSESASKFYIWGAQLEAGAYPTTYIPTTSATATRVADSFSRSNIYTNGLISASGGTWFVELRNNIVYTRDAGNTGIFIGDDTNATNSFRFRTFGGGARIAIVKSIATVESTLFITTTDTVKFAIKWNGSTADVFVNGTKQVSGTLFTTTAMEFLMGNANDCPKFIQQMALFNTPLTDAQCQTLTT